MVLETLFSAAVESMVGKLIDLPEMEEKARQWLKQEPVQQAQQKALARAYTALARRYPEVTDALFDQTFLTNYAAPELARLLQRDHHPDPAHLAATWQAYIGAPDREPPPLIVKSAADFLGWFEAELRAEPVLQPFFDAQALERLPVLESHLARLTEELTRAIEVAAGYQPVVNHTHHISHSHHIQQTIHHTTQQTIYNSYFTADFAGLDELYDPPDAVFQRVDVANFVGRAWLTAKVDEWLNDPNQRSGVFLLEGEAGVGKTAFMAHLVRERRYLHLFGEQYRGEARLPLAIQSLAAQLVARYQIAPYARREAIPQTLAVAENFLERLLRLAASSLTAGDKLVIVGDGLDEAAAAPGGNVFGLPRTLPDGVYLILAQRPVPTALHFTTAIPHRERLAADSPDNQRDLTAYLTTVAQRPSIAAQLRAGNYTPNAFVNTLAEKSGGVWMYLHYLIRDIEAGRRAPLDLERLPSGLAGYYADYWTAWYKDRQGEVRVKWDELYAPLLTTLAVVQEPISLEQLTTWAGVAAPPRQVQRLLHEQWAAFISQRQAEGQAPHYQIYHASLRDFISGRVERDSLPPAGRYLVEELAEGTVAAHARIVETYRQACDGDWPRLAAQPYPRRYLVYHLAGAQENETLFKLVAQDDGWAKARYREEGSYAGYQLDLEQARAWAERMGQVGFQLRCVLIESGLRSLAGNIEPKLIGRLVEAGMWSPVVALNHLIHLSDQRQAETLRELSPLLPAEIQAEALAAARAIEDRSSRVTALSGLVRNLPKSDQGEILKEALMAVKEIGDGPKQAVALSRLAGYLSVGLLEEALVAARKIEDDGRAMALSEVMGHLTEGLLEETLAAVKEIGDKSLQVKALRRLAEQLPREKREKVLEEALATAKAIEYEVWRAEALRELASQLPVEQRGEVLEEALAAAREIEDEVWRAEALRKLAGHLSEVLLDEILVSVREIKDEARRVSVLSEIADHLSEEKRRNVLEEVLASVREIKDEARRASVLSKTAVHLPKKEREKVLEEVLVVTRKVKDNSWWVSVLSRIGEYLPEEEREKALKEALAAVQATRDKSWRTITLREILEHLPECLLEKALVASHTIGDECSRVMALSEVAGYLREAKRMEVIGEVLVAARGVGDESWRAKTLRTLVDHFHLPPSLLQKALTTAQEIKDERSRVMVLSSLAKQLPEDERKEVLREALDVAQEIKDKCSRVIVLSSLARQLLEEDREKVLREALAVAREIEHKSWQANTLTGLGRQLPEDEREEVLREALAAAREIGYSPSQVVALRELADYLPSGVLREALTTAQEIKDERSRVMVLSSLAKQLPEDEREEVLRKALAVAREIGNESWRAEALGELAGHLPGKEREGVLREAVDAVREIEHEVWRSEALRKLVAGHLPVALLREVLDGVQKIESEMRRVSVYKELAGHRLPEGLLEEVLAAVRAIEDDYNRVMVLSPFTAQLSIKERKSLLLTLIHVRNIERWKDNVLCYVEQFISAWQEDNFDGLTPHLPVWSEALRILSRARRDDLLITLAALAPLINHLGGPAAVGETVAAIRDVGRWWP